MKREDKKAETRQRIIEAACELMLKNGIQKTSVKEISDGAGISLVTLYKYFKTKEQITEEFVIKLFDQEMIMPKQGQANSELPFIELFAMYSRGSALARRDVRPEVLMEVSNVIQSSERVKDYIKKRSHAFWQQMIDYGRNRGEIRSDVPDSVIQMQFAMMADFITRARPEPVSDQEIQQLESLMMYGLAGKQK